MIISTVNIGTLTSDWFSIDSGSAGRVHPMIFGRYTAWRWAHNQDDWHSCVETATLWGRICHWWWLWWWIFMRNLGSYVAALWVFMSIVRILCSSTLLVKQVYIYNVGINNTSTKLCTTYPLILQNFSFQNPTNLSISNFGQCLP